MTDTSVSQDQSLSLENAHANLPNAVAYGFVNVFEGSRVTIRAAVKKGGLMKREGTWHIENVSTGAIEQVKVKIGSSATEAQHVLELAKVPPEEASYRIRYKLEFKDQMIPGQAEFVVWPRSIDMVAKHAEDAKDGSYKKGDPAKGFSYKISQQGGGVVDTSPFCDDKGERKNHPLKVTGAFKVLATGSWEITTWKKGETKGRELEVEVKRKPYEAKVWNLPDTTADDDAKRHKQWVNQPYLPVAYFGQHMLLRIGAKEDQHQTDVGLRLGTEGDTIHVQVEFHADNSKVKGRGVLKKDLTRLPAEPNTEDRTYKVKVTLGASGAPAELYVDLGPAGGDKCTIKVGTTDACDNQTIYVQSWRRIGFGLLIAKKEMRYSSPTVIKDDSAELGDGLKAKLKTVLNKVFIEPYYPGDLAGTFAEADIDGVKGTDWEKNEYTTAKGEHVVIDAAYYANWIYDKSSKTWSKPPLAGKLFIPTSDLLGAIRTKVLSTATYKKDQVDMRWCDLIAARENKTSYDAATKQNYFSASFETTAPQDIDILDFNVFKYDPVRADGTRGVQGIRWKVLQIKKGTGAWEAPSNGKPGWAQRDWQNAPADSDTNIAKFVTFPDSRSAQLKLPNTAATDPGKLITVTRKEDDGTGTNTQVDVTYTCKILLEIRCLGVHFNINGNAFGGYINMSTRANKGADQGESHVIAHELGHNLGQAYIKNLGAGELHDTPPGSDNRGRATEMPGVPFGKVVPDGPYFAGKGFAGAHCAARLKKKVDTDLPGDGKAAERKAVYDEPNWGKPSDTNKAYFDVPADEQCIMYATSDMSETKALEFCEDCTKNIIATDASDIRKDWRSA